MNYSVALGRRLDLADLFTPESDYLTRLAGYANKDFGERGYTLPSENPLVRPDSTVLDTWLVVPEGLKLVFSSLFVCCGPAGEGEVVVPYAVYGDIVEPSFQVLWES